MLESRGLPLADFEVFLGVMHRYFDSLRNDWEVTRAPENKSSIACDYLLYSIFEIITCLCEISKCTDSSLEKHKVLRGRDDSLDIVITLLFDQIILIFGIVECQFCDSME